LAQALFVHKPCHLFPLGLVWCFEAKKCPEMGLALGAHLCPARKTKGNEALMEDEGKVRQRDAIARCLIESEMGMAMFGSPEPKESDACQPDENVSEMSTSFSGSSDSKVATDNQEESEVESLPRTFSDLNSRTFGDPVAETDNGRLEVSEIQERETQEVIHDEAEHESEVIQAAVEQQSEVSASAVREAQADVPTDQTDEHDDTLNELQGEGEKMAPEDAEDEWVLVDRDSTREEMQVPDEVGGAGAIHSSAASSEAPPAQGLISSISAALSPLAAAATVLPSFTCSRRPDVTITDANECGDDSSAGAAADATEEPADSSGAVDDVSASGAP